MPLSPTCPFGPPQGSRTVALAAMVLAACSCPGQINNEATPGKSVEGSLKTSLVAAGLSKHRPVESYYGNFTLRQTFPGINPVIGLPFSESARENKRAEARIGPFELDLIQLQAGLLWSDNVDRVEFNKESDLIGIVQTSASLRAQFGEHVGIRVGGTFGWLPFENEIGVAGFGLTEPLRASGTISPLFDTTLTYENHTDDWEFEFINQARLEFDNTGSISTAQNLEVWRPLEFNEADRAGRYRFFVASRGRNTTSGGNNDRFDESDLVFINLTGATARRMLPTLTELEVSVFHREFEYTQEQPGDRSWEQGLTVNLTNKREDMRFQPFAQYKVVRSDEYKYRMKEVIGVKSDLSDYTSIIASAGAFQGERSDGTRNRNTEIYRVAVVNDLTPTITHSAGFEREVEDTSTLYVTDRFFYELYKVVNGWMTYGTRFEWRDREPLEGPDQRSRSGIFWSQYLNIDLKPYGNVRLSSFYDENASTVLAEEFDLWAVTAAATYNLSDTATLSLTMQHRERNDSVLGESYKENLIFMNFAKSLY